MDLSRALRLVLSLGPYLRGGHISTKSSAFLIDVLWDSLVNQTATGCLLTRLSCIMPKLMHYENAIVLSFCGRASGSGAHWGLMSSLRFALWHL